MMSNKANPAFILAIVFLSLVVMPGCERLKNYSEQELVQRAKDFQGKGDLKAAVIELKNALQKNQNNAEARLLLGQIYVEAGDGNSAEKELLKAGQLGLNPESTKVDMGRALLLQGQFSRVLQEIQSTDKTSQGNSSKILQIHGDAYLGLGKIREACTSFTNAKEKDSTHVPTYWGLAKCFAVQGNFDQAKSQLGAALKLNNKKAETWVLMGDLESLRNNLKAAEAGYLSAKKADANNVSAYLGLTSLYIREHELGKAENELKAARKAAPGVLKVHYMQALVAFQQKKYSEARDELEVVLKAVPDHMPSVLLSGEIAFALGNYEKSESDLSQFLAQYPNSILAKKMLAATLLKKGNSARALNILKPVLTEETKDTVLLMLASEACMAMKEYGKATEYLEKAAAIDPGNAEVRTELGVSRLAQGDNDRALAELESAALDPSQYKADTILIRAYLGKKEFDKALQAIAALEKKQPKNPVTFSLEGSAYLGKKDFAGARKSFEHVLALQPTHVIAATNLAQLDLKDGHPEAARKRFEDVLAKDRSNVPAMLALADLAGGQGQEHEYAGWLEKAAKTNPTAIQPRALLARYYVKKNELQKALTLAYEANAVNPKNPEALDLLGSVQFSAGQKDNALLTYNKLVQLLPRSPYAQFMLASVQAATKDEANARMSLNRALALKPNYYEALIALAFLEMQTGRPLEAIKIAKNLQKQSPNSPLGFSLEGEALMAQKKYTEAANVFKSAFAISKSGLLLVKAHRAQALAGDSKNTEAGLLLWLQEQPDDFMVREYLAQAYTKELKTKQAIEQYEIILSKSPKNILVLNNLAGLYQQEKDARALPTAEQAYKQKPNDALVADTLGWILLEQGKIAQGVEVLQKAVANAPKNLEVGYHYAVALAKLGDKAKARKQLEALLASGQEFPQREKAKALLKQL